MMYAGGPISWLFKLSIPTSTKKSFYISTQEEMNKNIIWVRKTDFELENEFFPVYTPDKWATVVSPGREKQNDVSPCLEKQ